MTRASAAMAATPRRRRYAVDALAFPGECGKHDSGLHSADDFWHCLTLGIIEPLAPNVISYWLAPSDFAKNLGLALAADYITPAHLARLLNRKPDKVTIGRWLKGTPSEPRDLQHVPKIAKALKDVEGLLLPFGEFLDRNPRLRSYHKSIEAIRRQFPDVRFDHSHTTPSAVDSSAPPEVPVAVSPVARLPDLSAFAEFFTIANQPDMHREAMLDYIKTNKPKLIRLFHFSGMYCRSLVPSALEVGAEVRLYVKDPDFAKERSALQRNMIKDSLRWYTGESGFPISPSLRIFFCKFWPAIKATIIDRDMICLGPYLLDSKRQDEWRIVPYPEILIERKKFPGFDIVLQFLDSYEKTMVAEELEPFGLWLIPAVEHATALNEIIENLATRFRTPLFPAHVTLCSGHVAGMTARGEITDRLDRFCRQVVPISVAIDDIEQTDDYGTFFFAKLNVDDGAAATLQSRIAAVIDAPERPKVGLHLSLMYSEPSQTIDRVKVAEEVTPKLPSRVVFDRIQIVMPLQGDWRDVANWQVIHTAKLGD